MTRETLRRSLLVVTALVAGGSALLRLWLNLTRTHLDQSVSWRLVETFSYFTMTTNLLAAGVAGASVLRPDSRLAQPGVFAATAVYILVVAVTYQLLLRGDPHGLSLVADLGLHALAPALFIACWLALVPRRDMAWTAPLGWLAYPAAYMAWTLARGAMLHRYPYFFANVDRLGYPRALLNGLLFLVLFYLLGLGAVALGRLPRRRRAILPA